MKLNPPKEGHPDIPEMDASSGAPFKLDYRLNLCKEHVKPGLLQNEQRCVRGMARCSGNH